MDGIEHRTVSVNGINMHLAEKGAGPTVLLIHGFPQLWYTWRHQIHGLAARGYRAVAPDLRGFGDTDAPPSAASYTVYHIVGDLIALIDLLGQDQEPGAAEAVFARVGAERMLKIFFTYRHPGPLMVPKDGFGAWPDKELILPSWMSEADFGYYTEKFNKKGFTGGLNYYRALNLTWELTAPWVRFQVKVPTKFIVGDLDLTYNSRGAKEYIHGDGFKKDVPFLQDVVVMKGVAHFINEEKPDEITDHIFSFFQKFN
ncbi:uncharacterized protein LOC131231776 isoform X2 [Magnolia sinica]|uniref:uncharacterized protein LOC131231776 isoform X2 n=1 Tax=Magnolia sinica TaxID=86752 RepID=UPI0026593F6A|nr:uncharacterized protein LOC131231776 isoform X2 [Magnolia sinica]